MSFLSVSTKKSVQGATQLSPVAMMDCDLGRSQKGIEPISMAVPIRGYRTKPNVRKIKMTIFEGKDPELWIYQVEHYFALHEFSPASKLRAVRSVYRNRL